MRQIAVAHLALLSILLVTWTAASQEVEDVALNDFPGVFDAYCMDPRLQASCAPSTVEISMQAKRLLDRKVRLECVVGVAERRGGYDNAPIGCVEARVSNRRVELPFEISEWEPARIREVRGRCYDSRHGPLANYRTGTREWAQAGDQRNVEVDEACMATVVGTPTTPDRMRSQRERLIVLRDVLIEWPD